MEYSLLLALNALCSIASTQFSPGLMKLWGPRMVLRSVGAVGVILTIILTALLAAGVMNLIIFMAYSMLVFTLSGLMLTPAAVAALDTVKENVGAAAGMLGTIQLAIVASASALISVLPDTSVVPLAAVLGGVFVFSWALTSGEEAPHSEEIHNQGESPNGDN
jgi:DHA1 family bicyclomycin/chloramphenicol resistance-like MFS transporter